MYFTSFRQMRFYNLDDIHADIVSLPIVTAHDAAVYAKTSDKYSLPTKKETNTEIAWRVYTEKIPEGELRNFWTVNIHSSGILPSYQCVLQFNSMGVWSKNDCKWNK